MPELRGRFELKPGRPLTVPDIMSRLGSLMLVDGASAPDIDWTTDIVTVQVRSEQYIDRVREAMTLAGIIVEN